MTASFMPNLLLLQAAPSSGGSLYPFLFQLAAISAIIYFFMIRPQQKQRKQHEERLRNLKRGDTIVTSGGIVGEIVHMKDTGTERSMDDHITIKSAESRLIIERGRIAKVMGDAATTAPPSK
ncbi:MAG: preprotein translocase subunit YajC [Gemmatimonadaceae bacterium]